jgi:hypothetical protein
MYSNPVFCLKDEGSETSFGSQSIREDYKCMNEYYQSQMNDLTNYLSGKETKLFGYPNDEGSAISFDSQPS